MDGVLKNLTEQELASRVMTEAAQKAGISPSSLDGVILGVSKQTSNPSNCARHAALLARFPAELSAYTVQRQSASGLQAIYCACLNIRSNYARLVMAGGCESASNMPIEIRDARYSFGSSTRINFDMEKIHQIGAQPRELYGELKGSVIAERLAIRHNISHKMKEEYAEMSLEKAKQNGSASVLTLEVRIGKKTEYVSCDQLVNKSCSLPLLADGAAILLLAKKPMASRDTVLAEILDIYTAAGAPDRPEETIYKALAHVLDKNGLTIEQLDRLELGEISAVCSIAVLKLLTEAGVGQKHLGHIVNTNGGMLAYGNTWGASGSIMLDRLIHDLRKAGGGYGASAVFAEGGQAMAILVRVNG